jgi:hypothetical protein
MIPIKQSPLASYFDEVPVNASDLNDLGFLDAAEAAQVWQTNFDSKAKGLYDLPDECWVVRNPWSVIGTWIDAYNGSADPAGVHDAIVKASDWPTNEPLLLVQNSRNIVTLSFASFSKYWQELLAAFDDGPILMPSDGKVAAIFRFSPLGHIMQTSSSRRVDHGA